MKITVFGASAPKAGQVDYEDALRLGSLLAQAGHIVLTGGYMGTMEAVSRGAVEAGGHTIGVTCEELERWRPTPANPWVLEEWKRPTLTRRMDTMMDSADAMIALPGGPGTLTEISLAWNRMLIASLSPRPLILIGDGWRTLFATLFQVQEAYVPIEVRSLLTFVETVEQAIQALPR